MTDEKAFQEIPHPDLPPRLGVMISLSGWCSECGAYRARVTVNEPILDPNGEPHTHSRPWRLGPKP